MTLHIFKTNNYPYYEHQAETFENMEDAMKRMEDLGRELIRQCNHGELQDYTLEIR